MRSEAAAERLLEDSWEARPRGAAPRAPHRGRRRRAVPGSAPARCCSCRAPRAASTRASRSCSSLLYALVSRVEFPVGAGNVLPTQLVLVPMLVLLPPATVPLLVAAGLVLARLWTRCAAAAPRCGCSSRSPTPGTPSGPALVLVLAGAPQLDLWRPSAAGRRASRAAASSTPGRPRCARRRRAGSPRRCSSRSSRSSWWSTPAWRRSASSPAAPPAQHLRGPARPAAGRAADAARARPPRRIEQAQHRLELAVRERSRLQSAVRRMGDAFAAKLDLDALVDIMLRGSIEALDADAGCLALDGREPRRLPEDAPEDLRAALAGRGRRGDRERRAEQIAPRRRLGARAAVRRGRARRPERRRRPSPAARARSRPTRSSC